MNLVWFEKESCLLRRIDQITEAIILVDSNEVGIYTRKIIEFKVSEEFAGKQKPEDNWSAAEEKLGNVIFTPWSSILYLERNSDLRNQYI